MNSKRVRIFVLIVVFLLLVSVIYSGVNTNIKLLASIDRIYHDPYITIDVDEKKHINIINETDKAAHKYLEKIYYKKRDVSKYSYSKYKKENINHKIYKNIDNIIYETKNYIENEFKSYNELVNYSKRKKFIKHLNINVDNYDNSSDILNDLIDADKKKYDELLTYLEYLHSNKDKWYYVNKIIVCKDEETLKTIESKNRELNLDIKIVLESKDENVKKIPVLMYHGVSDVTWGIANLFMKVSDFEDQLKYIHDNYETIFVEEMDDFGSKKAVVLTFDDGYVDFYTNVLPLLKKYNIKANLYVIEGADGGVYLTKSQVKEIADSNLVSIGSHTKTHPTLTGLNSEQLDYELRESKKGLEKLIGKEVKTICYPTGAYNKKVLEYTSKYYDYGLAIENGVQKMYDDYNKLAIKRFRVYRNTSFSKFKSMVDQAN